MAGAARWGTPVFGIVLMAKTALNAGIVTGYS